MEREDDDLLINKVKSISSSSNSQNDKLIAALQVAIIVVLFMLISPFASLYDHFNTWPESEISRPKSLKVGKCTTAVRSGWSHNSNLSEKRYKVLTNHSRPIQASS